MGETQSCQQPGMPKTRQILAGDPQQHQVPNQELLHLVREQEKDRYLLRR